MNTGVWQWEFMQGTKSVRLSLEQGWILFVVLLTLRHNHIQYKPNWVIYGWRWQSTIGAVLAPGSEVRKCQICPAYKSADFPSLVNSLWVLCINITIRTSCCWGLQQKLDPHDLSVRVGGKIKCAQHKMWRILSLFMVNYLSFYWLCWLEIAFPLLGSEMFALWKSKERAATWQGWRSNDNAQTIAIISVEVTLHQLTTSWVVYKTFAWQVGCTWESMGKAGEGSCPRQWLGWWQWRQHLQRKLKRPLC